MLELLEHLFFFGISTRITAVMVTAFCQVRRAGHNKHFSVTEGSSDAGVGCTPHMLVSESCSVADEACGSDISKTSTGESVGGEG